MNTCCYCKQALLLDDVCPCRNYMVWDDDRSVGDARRVRASSHGWAAEEYVSHYCDDLEDGEEREVYVQNYLGQKKKVIVTCEITIDYTSQVEDFEESEAG